MQRSLRMTLILRGITAHFIGLFVASLWVTIRIGFEPIAGAIEGTLMGAVFASPWAFAMTLLFLFAAEWLERHIILLCLLGPPVVWATAYLLVITIEYFPEAWMGAVLVSSITASGTYFAMHRLGRRQANMVS